MKYTYEYKCDSCVARRIIMFDTERVGHHPRDDDIPEELVCGVRSCTGTQRRV